MCTEKEIADGAAEYEEIIKRIKLSMDDIAKNNVFDGEEVLKEMRKKYNYKD